MLSLNKLSVDWKRCPLLSPTDQIKNQQEHPEPADLKCIWQIFFFYLVDLISPMYW